MAAGSVLAFWTVALLLIAVPGADWAFTISAGLRGRSVVPAVGGIVTGYAVITLVVAAGVGALVAGSPALLTGLTLVGGVYLVWHGAATLAHAGPPDPSSALAPDDASGGAPAGAPGAASGGASGAGWRTFRRGIGVSGLNPKGLLVFLALLPQFTDPRGSWPMAGQIGVLGLEFTATCALFYLCLGTLARTVLHGRPAAARLAGRLSGGAMVMIGGWLVAAHLLG